MQTGMGWVATSSVYETYKSIIPEDTRILSYRRITDILVKLENTGLVVSRTVSHGRYGYGNEYKLKVSPEMVGSLLDKEWWQGVLEIKQKIERLENSLRDIKIEAVRRFTRKCIDELKGQ